MTVRAPWLVLAALAVAACGCATGGSSKEEEDAYDQLKPKALTDQQKQSLEKVKAGQTPSLPGH